MDFEKLVPDSLRKTADQAAEYILSNPEEFPLLFDGIIKHGDTIALRISRVFLLVYEISPKLVEPYIEEIYEVLLISKNGSVIRNFLSIMRSAHCQLSEANLSGFLDYCFKILENHQSEIAHEVLALASLYQVSNTFPELKSELKSIIELRYEESSPAFQAKSRSIIKRLNREMLE